MEELELKFRDQGKCKGDTQSKLFQRSADTQHHSNLTGVRSLKPFEYVPSLVREAFTASFSAHGERTHWHKDGSSFLLITQTVLKSFKRVLGCLDARGFPAGRGDHFNP